MSLHGASLCRQCEVDNDMTTTYEHHNCHRLLLAAILAAATSSTPLHSQNWKTILDLRGIWKIELGDNMKWAEPKFDDSKWDNIKVPSPWEDQGYPGYDGYAWYRKHFWIGSISSQSGTNTTESLRTLGTDARAPIVRLDLNDDDFRRKAVFLHIGYIDDVSEIYVNGHMIGFEGSFPPHYSTAYDSPVQFPLPAEYLNFHGDNVIAVRVYDDQLAGGITRGRVGLFEPENSLHADYSLAGVPLSQMALWNRPFARGDAIRVLTFAPPPDSPKIVTFPGSPPNWDMFLRTHLRAAIISRNM